MELKYSLCLLFVSLAVLNDYSRYKISNLLNLTFLILGFSFNIVTNGITGGIDALLGSALPLVLFPLFLLKMLGAGDIKAFCALGSILGLEESIDTVMFSFMGGGIIALVFLVLRKNALQRFKAFWSYLKLSFYTRKLLPFDQFTDEKGKFRFAYGIFLGLILTILKNY